MTSQQTLSFSIRLVAQRRSLFVSTVGPFTPLARIFGGYTFWLCRLRHVVTRVPRPQSQVPQRGRERERERESSHVGQSSPSLSLASPALSLSLHAPLQQSPCSDPPHPPPERERERERETYNGAEMGSYLGVGVDGTVDVGPLLPWTRLLLPLRLTPR